jgi:hypothetical protein
MDSTPARGLDWETAFRQRSTAHHPPPEDCGPARAHRCRQRRRSWATGAVPAPCAGVSQRETARNPWSKASLLPGVVPPTRGAGRPAGLRQHEACRWFRPRLHPPRGGVVSTSMPGHGGSRPGGTPRQRCRQVITGGRRRDVRTWRATVRCVVEARTPARAGGTGLPVRLPPPASAGRSRCGPWLDAPQSVGRLDVRASAAGPWWSEGSSTRAQHRVWQNHPLAASDRAGRRGGRPDLQVRRRVEVGEDIQSALRCPAADGPAGGRYVDAGWRRRPRRCRRRNPGGGEREVLAAVTLRRLESGSRCPVAHDHAHRRAPGPTCLVRRDVTRTANPRVTTVVAGRHPRRCAGPLGGPERTGPATRCKLPSGRPPEARRTAWQVWTMTRRLHRNGGIRPSGRCAVPHRAPLRRPGGEVPTLPVLGDEAHPPDVRGTLRRPQGSLQTATGTGRWEVPEHPARAENPTGCSIPFVSGVPTPARGPTAGHRMAGRKVEGAEGTADVRFQEGEAQESHGWARSATTCDHNGHFHGARP